MINKVTLIGRIGSAAEVRELQSGATVATFSLATNENYQKNGEWVQETTWHNIVCWRQLAERAAKIEKGSLLYLEGKITNRTYEDKHGQKKYITEILTNRLRVISKNERTEPTQPARTTQSAADGSDLPF